MSDDGTCSNPAETASHSTYLLYLLYTLATPTILWLILYTLPQLYMALRPVPDLKKRYDATWSLVTGAGSGIGKSLAFKLASQGLNVVLVSIDDDFLKATMKEIKAAYPKLEFRSVGVTFSPGVPYLQAIQDATKDIDIKIIFSNAGFIVTGFMDQTPLPKLLANIECNATASLSITHHFTSLLVQKSHTGCIVYTSSVSASIPCPFAASYGATKAFVTQMAACLHVEVGNLGIDVCAVHPSPVKSRFYEGVEHRIELMETAQRGAVEAGSLPDEIFKSVGVCALRDLGGLAVGTRMGTFFLPYNFFTCLFSLAAPLLPDYKVNNKLRK